MTSEDDQGGSARMRARVRLIFVCVRIISICGQVAGELSAVPALLGTGLSRLSVVPPIIPALKQSLRELSVPIAA